MSTETQTKVADALTKFGVEPRVDLMPAVGDDGQKLGPDVATWRTFNDSLRECMIFGSIPVTFKSDDGGKTWRGAFPMLGVTNASGSKVQSVGYLTETAGDFKTRTDHLAISLGRQLFDLAELLTSTDVQDTSVAALKAENAQLQAAHNAATVAATVMEIVYQGESSDGLTEVTPEMWNVLPLKLQQRIAANPATAEYIPADVTYADGSDIERAEVVTTGRGKK